MVDEMTNSTVIEVLAEISQQTKTSTASVKQQVIQTAVSMEVNKRATTLASALDRYKELKKEVDKLNSPDQEQFTTTDGPPTKIFSKQRIEDYKKAKDKLDKLVEGINSFLGEEENGYSKLVQAMDKAK